MDQGRAAQTESVARKVFRRLLANRLAMVGVIVVIAFVLVGVFGPQMAPMDPYSMTADQLTPYSREYPLGTDMYGRDILSRVLHGARPSLLVGLCSVALAMTVGSTIGFLGGYYRSLSGVLMRVTDIWLSFPSIIVALVLISVLGRGLDKVIYAVAVAQAAQFARLTFGLAVSIREHEYIESAKACGASDSRIIFRHLLPNCAGPLIIQGTILLPSAILLGSSLSFLGLGVPPPYSEWGAMLGDGRTYMRLAPHLMMGPGIALMLVVLAFNMVGDALRDALDPTTQRI